MLPPNEKQALIPIRELIAELLSVDLKLVEVRHIGENSPLDFKISAPPFELIAEFKRNSAAGMVAKGIATLKECRSESKKEAEPLIIVPFMGDVGKKLCDASSISWMDLCGNAKIKAPGLRIWIEGRPNKFIDRGRPPNIFSPKSSRISRQLLADPFRFHPQSELSKLTKLDDGYVSKIVSRLKQEEYVETNEKGAIRPRNPGLLLDAWQSAYNFNHHRITRGHSPARSGEELLHRLADSLDFDEIRWGVTGLGAAWLYSGFAAFRLVTVFLESMPSQDFFKELEFTSEAKGSNLWVVLPDDDSVFDRVEKREGISCVSPAQTYLDLKDQPERSKDAAVELRKRYLTWDFHAE